MLVEEATSRFFDEYLKRGSKAYRREKFSRLSEFLNWVETEKKVKGLGQIGTKHIIDFWRSHRDYSDNTKHKYWLAIKDMWDFLDFAGVPPKPLLSVELLEKEKKRSEIKNSLEKTFTDFGSALRESMRLNRIELMMLSNSTGIEPRIIDDITSGRVIASASQLNDLMKAFGVMFSITHLV